MGWRPCFTEPHRPMSHCSWDLRGAIVHAFWRAVRGEFLEPKRLPVPMMIDGCWLYSYTPTVHPHDPHATISEDSNNLTQNLRWSIWSGDLKPDSPDVQIFSQLPTSNSGLLLAMWPANDHPTLQSSSRVYLRSFFGGTPVVFWDHALKESERLTASARGVYLGGLVYSSIPPAA